MSEYHVTYRARHPLAANRKRAQVLVLFTLMLPVLVGAAGLLLDVGMMVHANEQLRSAATAAARAGAQEASMPLVAATDTFALADAGPAREAANHLCDSYRSSGLSGLQCTVDVSLQVFDPPNNDWPTRLAWLNFLRRDPTRRSPGLTVHGGVTVTATRAFRPFFMSAITHQRTIELSARQTAVLVTGP